MRIKRDRGSWFMSLAAVAVGGFTLLTVAATPTIAAATPARVATTPAAVRSASHPATEVGSSSQKYRTEDSDDQLSGVSCTSSNFCMAAGSFGECTTDCLATYTANSTLTLVEGWNGTEWSIIPTPDPTSLSKLSAVSCTSPTFCDAVGSDQQYPGTYPLVETWDGSSWSVVPSPSTDDANDLTAVSCTGPTFCMALGQYSDNQNLTEVWDGTSWSIVPSVATDSLTSVSCTSPSFCMATGGSGLVSGSTALFDTLAATWDGSSWSVVLTPDPGSSSSDLASVSCVSATSCKAAGYTLDGGEGVYTESNLVESWDGSNWTVDAGTGISSGQMSCSADPTFCMMRSYSSETWNGSVWSAVPSPAAAQYSGLSCPGPTFCATVGLYLSPQTGLVSGLWNGSTWSAAPVPSPDALSITTPSLPGGTVGLGYSVTLAASGGNPPYHWKVVTGSGALPRGLKLDKSTGVISGTPKSEGLSTFTIQVVDTATKPLKHALRVENLAQATFSIAIT